MAKQPRSHRLDQRLEALGYRLVRQDPQQFSCWGIIPTRKRCWLYIPNLDSVQSVVERLEEGLWLEFGRWLEERHIEDRLAIEQELDQAEHFLKAVKGMADEHVATVIRRWYEPTE